LDAAKLLESLSLAYTSNLENISTISALTCLTELFIENCRKIEDLESIGRLKSLRHLTLNRMGTLASLGFLEGLENLEKVLFWEDTRVADGIMRPLLDLPKLKFVGFRNRRHYTHRMEEINALLEQKAARGSAD
jgi:internalin A